MQCRKKQCRKRQCKSQLTTPCLISQLGDLKLILQPTQPDNDLVIAHKQEEGHKHKQTFREARELINRQNLQRKSNFTQFREEEAKHITLSQQLAQARADQ